MEAKYILDKRDKRPDSTIPLKVKVYQSRNSYTLISLKIYLLPEQWNGDKIVNHPESGILNSRLKFYQLNIGKVLLDIDMSDENPSLNIVRDCVKAAINGKSVVKSISFSSYYQQHIDKTQNLGTKENHKWTLAKVNQFTNGRSVQFSDINVKWLNDFERFRALQTTFR